jgi:hypothetical protein
MASAAADTETHDPFIVLISFSCFALNAQASIKAHERDLDFWVGEWKVQNRMLQAKGWIDAGVAKARIRPILGGMAILEEWNGESGGRDFHRPRQDLGRSSRDRVQAR